MGLLDGSLCVLEMFLLCSFVWRCAADFLGVLMQQHVQAYRRGGLTADGSTGTSIMPDCEAAEVLERQDSLMRNHGGPLVYRYQEQLHATPTETYLHYRHATPTARHTGCA